VGIIGPNLDCFSSPGSGCVGPATAGADIRPNYGQTDHKPHKFLHKMSSVFDFIQDKPYYLNPKYEFV
jgi:hypothetical protein